jgi:hypothetical protein
MLLGVLGIDNFGVYLVYYIIMGYLGYNERVGLSDIIRS